MLYKVVGKLWAFLEFCLAAFCPAHIMIQIHHDSDSSFIIYRKILQLFFDRQEDAFTYHNFHKGSFTEENIWRKKILDCILYFFCLDVSN